MFKVKELDEMRPILRHPEKALFYFTCPIPEISLYECIFGTQIFFLFKKSFCLLTSTEYV